MPLHSDDGTELPVKEGVILAPKEDVILYSADSQQKNREETIFVKSGTFQTTLFGKWPFLILVSGIVILTLALGTFILGLFLAVFITITVIQTILKILGIKS